MATGRGIGVLRLLGASRRERYGMERVGPQSSGGSHSPEITTVYVVLSLGGPCGPRIHEPAGSVHGSVVRPAGRRERPDPTSASM